MKSIVARFVGVCLGTFVMTSVAASCASSDEGVFPEKEDAAGGSSGDASIDASSGGSGGISTGGTSGSGGGTGGSSTGGTSGTGGSSTGGTSGVGGSSGTGGTSGSGGSTGTCNPAFCPSTGSGAPCCVTPNGPCGTDNGLGCQQTTGPDI